MIGIFHLGNFVFASHVPWKRPQSHQPQTVSYRSAFLVLLRLFLPQQRETMPIGPSQLSAKELSRVVFTWRRLVSPFFFLSFFLVRRFRFQPRLCWPTLPARQESKQEPKASLLEREGQKRRRGGLFIRRTNDKRTVAARRSLDGQVVAKLGPTSSSVFQAVADASTMCANNF